MKQRDVKQTTGRVLVGVGVMVGVKVIVGVSVGAIVGEGVKVLTGVRVGQGVEDGRKMGTLVTTRTSPTRAIAPGGTEGAPVPIPTGTGVDIRNEEARFWDAPTD